MLVADYKKSKLQNQIALSQGTLNTHEFDDVKYEAIELQTCKIMPMS
jgi:hypothetical protein